MADRIETAFLTPSSGKIGSLVPEAIYKGLGTAGEMIYDWMLGNNYIEIISQNQELQNYLEQLKTYRGHEIAPGDQ